MDDIFHKLNIFVENNHFENQKITYQLSNINYYRINQLCLRAPQFTLSQQLSMRVEKFSYGTLTIGSFKINVHMKKSVKPNLHYMSNETSLTRLVFELLHTQ